MEEAGQSIGFLSKGLAVLNKEVVALMDVLKDSMRITRRFFDETLVEIGRTLKYIFTGSWFRKKKKVDKQAEPAKKTDEEISDVIKTRRQTNPFLIPPKPINAQNEILGEPRLNVVLSQLNGWAETNDENLVNLSKRIAKLDKYVQLYIAYEAIRGWYELLSGDENDIKRAQKYLNSLPLYGGLSGTFLIDHVSKFLRQKKDSELSAAASEWVKDATRKIADNVKPDLEEVERQFLTNTSISNNRDLIKFMAGVSIEEWNGLNIRQRAGFITDVSKAPEAGQLPIQFIRTQKKQRQKLASIYLQLIESNLSFKQFPISIAIKRVKTLYSAWEDLPEDIKNEFRSKTDGDKMSQEFIRLFASSLNVGISPRESINRSDTPWKYIPRQEKESYKGIIIDNIKLALVNENEELGWYPDLLEARAKTLIEDWFSLPINIKTAFLAHDKKIKQNSNLIGVSITFIKMWSKMNSGIGIEKRPPLLPEGGDKGPNNLGGISGGNSGSQSPPEQNNNMSYSKTMHGMPFNTLGTTLNLYQPNIHQPKLWSYEMLPFIGATAFSSPVPLCCISLGI